MALHAVPGGSGGGGGSTAILQYDNTDPVSPAAHDAWVLRTGTITGGGEAMGLLLALTYAASGSYTYQFSYRTEEGTTIRATLT